MDSVCGFLAGHNPLLMPPSGNFAAKNDGYFYRRLSYGKDKFRIGSGERQVRGRSSDSVRLGGAISIIVLILCIAAICLIFLFVLPWTVPDESYAHVPIDDSHIRFVEVERNCEPNDRTNCCTVADIIDRQKGTARRAMFLGIGGEDFETEVPLLRPRGLSVHNSDTRLWRVDHRTLLNEYVAAMALTPFMVNALGEPQANTNRSMLVVGLGGGSLDMFLHAKFPMIDIAVVESDRKVVQLAQKWFDSVDDATRHTVVGDGLWAVGAALKRGHRYDAIIVDACNNDEQMPCPDAKFAMRQALQDVKSALKPMGAFVLNVLPLKEEEEVLAKVQQKLLIAFPLCVRVRLGRQLNVIFTCLPYGIEANDLNNTKMLWRDRLNELAEHFGLADLLVGAKISIGKI